MHKNSVEVVGPTSNDGPNNVNVSMYKDVMTIDIKNRKSTYIKMHGFMLHLYCSDDGYADITIWPNTKDKSGEITVGIPKGYKKHIRRF